MTNYHPTRAPHTPEKPTTMANNNSAESKMVVPAESHDQDQHQQLRVEEDFERTLLHQPRRRIANLEDMMAYLKANPDLLCHPEDVEHLVLEEFPQITTKPSLKDVDRSVLSNGSIGPFALGDYAERLGDDMVWHLEPIRRVIHFSDEPEEEYYRFESGILVNSKDVRCSEEGIKRLFGMRPHLWQQWAMFRFENLLRFQSNHERDFYEVDYLAFAEEHWEKWLTHPKNADFLALYNAHAAHVQRKLKKHMFTPFEFCHQVLKDEKKWDFERADCSVYQYASFLGSGFVSCLVCIFLQLTVPFMILLYTVRVSTNFPNFTIQPNSSSLDMERIWSTTWYDFCQSPRALDTIYMNYVIFFVYMIRVLPSLIGSVYDTVGDSSSLKSRLNSLRYISWIQQEDSIAQKIGYKMDKYMNSTYLSYATLCVMLSLFITNNTVDLVLNALAGLWLTGFDEESASESWYDPGKRYLKASVIEMQLGACIFQDHFNSVAAFCRAYGCTEEEYNAQVNGEIHDAKQAERDALVPDYMDVKDKIWFSSAIVARDTDRPEALWQFEEPKATFGIIDNVIQKIWPEYLSGIFNRYTAYYTWSKWEAALFLPRVPEVMGEQASASEEAATSVANFDPSSMINPYVRFAWFLLELIMMGNLVKMPRIAYETKQFALIPFLALDAIVEWVFFMFLLVVTPCALLFYTYLVVACQPIMYSTGHPEALLYNTNYNFGG